MNKTIKILFPLILALAIMISCCWYLFFYDQEFTRDMLVSVARFCENNGYHSTATWFYDRAYAQLSDNDMVAIELANQYKKSGNYTKAEYTLRNAIQDGGTIDLYIALSQTFIEQDKLLDAVNMLNNVADPAIKQQLDQLRPAAPTSTPAPGLYNEYISVEVSNTSGTLYAANDSEYPSLKDDLYKGPITLTDGENNMYAVSVGENGLVSPLSIFGYTVGGIIKPVTFADPAVESAARELLSIESPTVIQTNDLWKIKEFTIPAEAKDYSDVALMIYLEKLTADKPVANQLSKLSVLTELTQLQLTNTTVSTDDLAAIAALPKLKSLVLSNCNIATITSLEKATKLEHLDLSSNAIRNVDALGKLTALKELYLQHNAIAKLQNLSSLKELKTLDVSYNAITDLTGATSAKALTHLNAESNAITQLSKIGSLTGLTYLNLQSNKLKEIGNLSGCTALTELDLSDNSLTDISDLSKLVNLTTLDFSNNSVTTIPTWSKNCALVSIDGSKNKIKSLDPLSGLKSLNQVHMDYNSNISSVKPLEKCPLLVEVNVYGTKVKSVSGLTDQGVIVNYKPV